MSSNSKFSKKLVRKLLGKNSEKYVQPNYFGDESVMTGNCNKSVMAGSCIVRGVSFTEAYDAIVIYDQRRKIYEPDGIGSIRMTNVELDVVTVRKLW